MCLDALALQTLQQAAPGDGTIYTLTPTGMVPALHMACAHVILILTSPQATSSLLESPVAS